MTCLTLIYPSLSFLEMIFSEPDEAAVAIDDIVIYKQISLYCKNPYVTKGTYGSAHNDLDRWLNGLQFLYSRK